MKRKCPFQVLTNILRLMISNYFKESCFNVTWPDVWVKIWLKCFSESEGILATLFLYSTSTGLSLSTILFLSLYKTKSNCIFTSPNPYYESRKLYERKDARSTNWNNKYQAEMKAQDAKDAWVWGETATDTWGKLLKAQSPIRIPLVASHQQLTHPSQPTRNWNCMNQCKGQGIKLHKAVMWY